MEIKKLFDVNLQENVVQMDSESELNDAISQAVDQKVESLDSAIEQKAGEAAYAMLSSIAFKDVIDGILRQYGLISKNAQPVINDDGITIDINNPGIEDGDVVEGEGNTVFALEFDLEHVSIKRMTRRVQEGVSNYLTDTVLDPIPASLDLNDRSGTDEYDICFQSDEGYTIDYFNSNSWPGSETKNVKAFTTDLIENKGWPASAYNMDFSTGIKLSWTKRVYPDLDTIHITVRAIPIDDPAENPVEG